MAKVVAADCPKCGAGLTIAPAATSVRCDYCGTTSQVQQGGSAPPPGVPTIVVTAAGGWWRTWVVLGAVGTIAIVLLGVLSSSAETRTDMLERVRDPSAWPRSTHEPLEVCLCRTDLDGDRTNETTAQLAARVEAYGDEYLTTYWLDITGRDPWLLPVGERTAPSLVIASDQVEMYMACRGTILAIASGDLITGWDLVARKAAWATPLGGRYTSDMPKPPLAPGDFNFQCTRLDGDNPEVFEIPTEYGPVRVRMADGMVVQ